MDIKKTIIVLFFGILFLTVGLHATLVYTNDFEMDNGGAIVSNDAVWEWGHPTAGDYYILNMPYGTNCWATIITGYYGYNQTSYLAFTNINLTGANYATLEFDEYHYFYSSSCHDGVDFWISTNGSPYFKVGTCCAFYNKSSVSSLGSGPGWA